ncbi:PadR family transcriptional regulator [Plantibacter sp. Mn2098]|uniref:PadR family transcriptional regulator n=1 Tax=Plantibacter sp. Mn2098 TaxID=3395266 RepID=UPI003BD5AEBB
MTSLSPTAHTILGYLASHPRSGYEIKQAASRNPFWGISDGQLYPQLRSLADALLIESDGADAPRGKTVWRITAAGRDELLGWLRSDSAPVAVRDENLVKLLFAARVDHDAAKRLLHERRRQFEFFRDAAAASTPGATWTAHERASAASVPELVRDYGLAYAETALAWCDRALSAIDEAGTDR